MKTSVAAGVAAASLITISILALPAVASGSEYLSEARSASQTTTAEVSSVIVDSQNTDIADTNLAASRSTTTPLGPLITAWGISGVALFGGGAVAVALSVRNQRRSRA